MSLDFLPGSAEWNRLVLDYDPFEGDFGNGSERKLCDEIRVVKRRGKCRECGQDVARGTFARTIKKADSEGLYGGRICQDCCNCMAKIVLYMEQPCEDGGSDEDPYAELCERMALSKNSNVI